MKHDPMCKYDGDPKWDYLTYCEVCPLIAAVRADEARKAADRVEALPWSSGGAKVGRSAAIMAARGGRPRFDPSGGE